MGPHMLQGCACNSQLLLNTHHLSPAALSPARGRPREEGLTLNCSWALLDPAGHPAAAEDAEGLLLLLQRPSAVAAAAAGVAVRQTQCQRALLLTQQHCIFCEVRGGACCCLSDNQKHHNAV